jgi:branched-chain amino acid transport system substrate-binding protein
MKMKGKKTIRFTVTALALVCFWSCGGSDSGSGPEKGADTFRIGLLFPMSGPWVKGPAWRNAAEMAAAEINRNGGVLGRQIELLIADTETVPERAAIEAQNLVEAGVSAIVGAAASSSTVLAAERATVPGGILLISPASTSPSISGLDDNGLVWRTVASDIFQGRIAAQYAYEQGARRAGILFVDNPYGQGLAAAFSAEFGRLGGETINSVAYPELSSTGIDGFDYGSRVRAAFSGEPDLFYMITYDQDGAKITVVAAGHITDDYRPLFLGCDGNQSQAFVDNSAPKVVEGMIGTLQAPSEDDPGYVAFAQGYAKLYGIEPESFSESTYDAVYLVALAAARAGSLESPAIAAHMQTVSVGGQTVGPADYASALQRLAAGGDIDYRGATGAVDFDANGDMASGAFRIWRIEGGRFVTLRSVAFP